MYSFDLNSNYFWLILFLSPPPPIYRLNFLQFRFSKSMTKMIVFVICVIVFVFWILGFIQSKSLVTFSLPDLTVSRYDLGIEKTDYLRSSIFVHRAKKERDFRVESKALISIINHFLPPPSSISLISTLLYSTFTLHFEIIRIFKIILMRKFSSNLFLNHRHRYRKSKSSWFDRKTTRSKITRSKIVFEKRHPNENLNLWELIEQKKTSIIIEIIEILNNNNNNNSEWKKKLVYNLIFHNPTLTKVI